MKPGWAEACLVPSPLPRSPVAQSHAKIAGTVRRQGFHGIKEKMPPLRVDMTLRVREERERPRG